MENSQLYQTLVKRYLDNTASQEELDLFFHLLQEGKLDTYLEEMSHAAQSSAPVVQLEIETKKLRRSFGFLRYAIAASLILAISTATYLFNQNKSATSPQALVRTNLQPQAAPGSKKAILLLSDGRKILLDESEQTIHDANANIISEDNRLVYQSNPSTQIAYNTITTPKGGEYKLSLPDGSQVWLNAESSLRYPTAFSGAERVVELTGEAYFEVAKNREQPFIVHSKEAEVKVLGTHFNVMAYDDENYMKTTLEEGAVLLKKNGKEVMLKPGEGGTIVKGSGTIAVAKTDINQDLAWKNGNFYFQKTELAAIMKQIARWYDLEIRYAGAVPKKRFVGKISRNTNLSDVLDVLRLSDVRFSMTGKTLIVEE